MCFRFQTLWGCVFLLIWVFCDARYLPIKQNLRAKRQSLLESGDPVLNPLTNPTGYDPSLLSAASAASFQPATGGTVGVSSGTTVGGGLNLDGVPLLGGPIFSSTTGTSVGSGGVVTGDTVGVPVAGDLFSGFTGAGTGGGLVQSDRLGLGGGNVFSTTDRVGFGPGGISTGTGIGVGGAPIFTEGSAVNFGPGGFGTSSGIDVAGAPIFSEGSNFNLGPGGFGTTDNVGVLGQDIFTKRSGLDLGSGALVGESINAGPFGITRTTGLSTGDENAPLRIGDQTSANVLGAEVFRGGSYTDIVPGSIPGLDPRIGGGIPDPYDPFGKYRGGWGIANGTGYNILGNGYDNPAFYGFNWPDDGVRVENNTYVPIFGKRIAEWNELNLNVKPRTISQWDFRDYHGFTTFGSGYREGWEGTGGINGYDFRERLIVPVLGTNVVDQKNGSGFDLAKFKFDKGLDAQYGPIRLKTDHTSFEAPWIGQLIQRGFWDGALKSAGYGTGIPGGIIPGTQIDGGVLPQRLMPGVPFIG